jgi:heme-degrading monooxygenase HmoA
MHAVVTRITVNDREAAPIQMRENVVPAVSQSPGFVAGYWTRGDDGGLSMVVFESEDAAKALSERVPSILSDAVTIDSIEVREVVAHA